MKRHLLHFGPILLTAVLLYSATAIMTNRVATAAEKGDTASTDLSNTNWDEEESEGDDSDAKEDNLSTVNWNEDDDTEEEFDGENLASEGWEDEDTEENTDDSEGLQVLKQEDIDKLESQERRIHFFGFVLFVGYILGGILTAFITRNRKIATGIPPELLILLHSVWPLELLLMPVFDRAAR